MRVRGWRRRVRGVEEDQGEDEGGGGVDEGQGWRRVGGVEEGQGSGGGSGGG